MRYEVRCHVPDQEDRDGRIKGLGGAGWFKTVDDVMKCLRNGDEFVVQVGGQSVQVIYKQHYLSGRWFVTTEQDSFPPTNLLHLPVC